MRQPYIGLPDQQFWKNEKGIKNGSRLDPVSDPNFSISQTDRIVTAGSCFAQHVAGHMTRAGFNHHVTERAHPIIPKPLALQYNYGRFSARYGNVYTARQLKQLLERAYGAFTPRVMSWKAKRGNGVIDPFRPQIQPGGFLSDEELRVDRDQHFRCVRQAIEEMDVFVFTLGLTEAWVDAHDGSVFPLAPGIVGGAYDPNCVAFRNFDETEVYDDLSAALSLIREIRPDVKIVLTVSPVPLNATYEDRHVLVSTVWSKSVLRIAAEKCTRAFSDCAYFPSYEIITSPHVRGRYFKADCRGVTPEGVAHVMRLFFAHYTNKGTTASDRPGPVAPLENEARRHLTEMEEANEIICDEESIANR